MTRGKVVRRPGRACWNRGGGKVLGKKVIHCRWIPPNSKTNTLPLYLEVELRPPPHPPPPAVFCSGTHSVHSSEPADGRGDQVQLKQQQPWRP